MPMAYVQPILAFTARYGRNASTWSGPMCVLPFTMRLTESEWQIVYMICIVLSWYSIWWCMMYCRHGGSPVEDHGEQVNSCRKNARKDAPAPLSAKISWQKVVQRSSSRSLTKVQWYGWYGVYLKYCSAVGTCWHTLCEWRGISWIWSWSREKAQRLLGLRLRMLGVLVCRCTFKFQMTQITPEVFWLGLAIYITWVCIPLDVFNLHIWSKNFTAHTLVACSILRKSSGSIRIGRSQYST